MAELITRRDGAVGFIEFSNALHHNALTYEMWRRMPEAVAQIERDGATRVIVVRGEGDGAFAAGADISEFDSTRDSVGATASYNQAVDDANAALLNCAKPTVASIRGPCIGGGLEIAAHCDVRFCAEDAVFALPAARLGMCYSYASSMRIVGLIGPAATAEMAFSGRRYSAREAQAMRLVNQVVAAGDLARAVAEYCTWVSESAPLTVAAMKRALIEGLRDPGVRDLRTVRAMIDACFGSDDYREGRAAYNEKRKPAFKGR